MQAIRTEFLKYGVSDESQIQRYVQLNDRYGWNHDISISVYRFVLNIDKFTIKSITTKSSSYASERTEDEVNKDIANGDRYDLANDFIEYARNFSDGQDKPQTEGSVY